MKHDEMFKIAQKGSFCAINYFFMNKNEVMSRKFLSFAPQN